jgi:glucose-6-phosphate 1-dehydrogenase
VGTSLEPHDRDSFLQFVRTSIGEFGNKTTLDGLAEFCERIRWAPGETGADGLRKVVEEAERDWGDADRRRLHYLSVPPAAALPVVHLLRDADLVRPQPDHHGEAVRGGPGLGP